MRRQAKTRLPKERDFADTRIAPFSMKDPHSKLDLGESSLISG